MRRRAKGLPMSQRSVLRVLLKQREISFVQIAAQAHISLSTACVAVAQLEQSGRIARQRGKPNSYEVM